MRVVVVGESPGDQIGILELVRGCLGVDVESVASPALRTRGWPSILTITPTVVRHVCYRSAADLLILAADADDSPVHALEHEAARDGDAGCRVCRLEAARQRAETHLTPVATRSRLLIGVAVAVPSIEAWYLCGRDAAVSEAAWINGLRQGQPPYTRSDLKRAVYGTDRPSEGLQAGRAREEAGRIVADGLLPRLELDFPASFGGLARALRAWSRGPMA